MAFNRGKSPCRGCSLNAKPIWNANRWVTMKMIVCLWCIFQNDSWSHASPVFELCWFVPDAPSTPSLRLLGGNRVDQRSKESPATTDWHYAAIHHWQEKMTPPLRLDGGTIHSVVMAWWWFCTVISFSETWSKSTTLTRSTEWMDLTLWLYRPLHCLAWTQLVSRPLSCHSTPLQVVVTSPPTGRI